MLQVNEIRENKEEFIQALTKRGFDATTIFDKFYKPMNYVNQLKLNLTKPYRNPIHFLKKLGFFIKMEKLKKRTF